MLPNLRCKPWTLSREAAYEVEEGRAVRSGLRETQLALKKSNQKHQHVSSERDQLQAQLQQEKEKMVRLCHIDMLLIDCRCMSLLLPKNLQQA